MSDKLLNTDGAVDFYWIHNPVGAPKWIKELIPLAKEGKIKHIRVSNHIFIGSVGIWGQRHYQYLKENKPTVVNVIRMKGNLKSYLREVDEQAEEMLFQLVRQMAKDEGVDEAMKRRDQLYWVGRMNNIRNRAEEIVLREVIYV